MRGWLPKLLYARRCWLGSLCAVACLTATPVLWAQDEPAEEAPAAQPAEQAKPLPTIYDPTIATLYESKPNTPAETVQVIRLLLDLNAGVYAKKFAQQLLEAKLNRDQLAELQFQFGTGVFAQIGLSQDLAPVGKQLADAVLAAARERSADPAYQNQWLDKLRSPNAQVRGYAASRLRASGMAVVNPLLKRLADPKEQAAHAVYRGALIGQGEAVVPALIAALEADEPTLVANVLLTLAQMNNPESVPYLLAPALLSEDEQVKQAGSVALQRLVGRVPTKAEAAQLVQFRARQYYDRDGRFARTMDGQVDWWKWDAAEQGVVSKLISVDDASVAAAAWLARDAAALDQANDALRLLHLQTYLEAAAYEVSLTGELSEDARTTAKDAGLDALLAVLEQSLGNRHAPAAWAAVQVIGDIGTPALLATPDSSLSLLVLAASDADRRVRLAAAEAIVKLKPTRDYPGCTFVSLELGYFVSATGGPRAVVADNNPHEAQHLVGLLRQLGYQVEFTADGREFFKLLSNGADCELALVSVRLMTPRAEYAMDQLRHDPRTANIPIAVVGNSLEQAEADRLARKDVLAAPLLRPADPAGMKFQLEPLMARRPRYSLVSSAERLKEGERALIALTALTEQAPDIYPFSRIEPALQAALVRPQLQLGAMQVLARIGKPSFQRGLVDLVNVPTQPIAARQAAVEAFAENVRRFGTLLTASEVLRQYGLYNAAETADPESQTVLGQVLDVIEKQAQQVAVPR